MLTTYSDNRSEMIYSQNLLIPDQNLMIINEYYNGMENLSKIWSHVD